MMNGDKVVIWTNGLGQSITFDNEDTLFVESIDMTGTSGIHTVESLAMADGQVSVGHQLGAKIIPCSFSWYGEGDDGAMRSTLAQIFSPLQSGTLTVLTKHSGYSTAQQYQIDCYPQSVPVFKRETNLDIWRFEVDFVADYPYWRKGNRKGIMKAIPTVTGDSRPSYSFASPVEVAPLIILPPAWSGTFSFNEQSFTIGAHEDCEITIDTQNFKIYQSSGIVTPRWDLIDSGVDLSKIRLRPGTNRYMYTANPSAGSSSVMQIYFYPLCLGEV